MAGRGQRAGAGVVEGVDGGSRVQQDGGHAGIAGKRGAVQRGVAFAVHALRVGAIGQQGEHRLGAAVPAVAGGGEQGGDAAAGAIHGGTLGDECAQQSQVGQQGGQHQHRALVAIVRRWRGVGVGAGIHQG